MRITHEHYHGQSETLTGHQMNEQNIEMLPKIDNTMANKNQSNSQIKIKPLVEIEQRTYDPITPQWFPKNTPSPSTLTSISLSNFQQESKFSSKQYENRSCNSDSYANVTVPKDHASNLLFKVEHSAKISLKKERWAVNPSFLAYHVQQKHKRGSLDLRPIIPHIEHDLKVKYDKSKPELEKSENDFIFFLKPSGEIVTKHSSSDSESIKKKISKIRQEEEDKKNKLEERKQSNRRQEEYRKSKEKLERERKRQERRKQKKKMKPQICKGMDQVQEIEEEHERKAKICLPQQNFQEELDKVMKLMTSDKLLSENQQDKLQSLLAKIDAVKRHEMFRKTKVKVFPPATQTLQKDLDKIMNLLTNKKKSDEEREIFDTLLNKIENVEKHKSKTKKTHKIQLPTIPMLSADIKKQFSTVTKLLECGEEALSTEDGRKISKFLNRLDDVKRLSSTMHEERVLFLPPPEAGQDLKENLANVTNLIIAKRATMTEKEKQEVANFIEKLDGSLLRKRAQRKDIDTKFTLRQMLNHEMKVPLFIQNLKNITSLVVHKDTRLLTDNEILMIRTFLDKLDDTYRLKDRRHKKLIPSLNKICREESLLIDKHISATKNSDSHPAVEVIRKEVVSPQQNLKLVTKSYENLISRFKNIKSNTDGTPVKTLTKADKRLAMLIHDVHRTHTFRVSNCALCIDSDIDLDLQNIVSANTVPVNNIIVGNKVVSEQKVFDRKINSESSVKIPYFQFVDESYSSPVLFSSGTLKSTSHGKTNDIKQKTGKKCHEENVKLGKAAGILRYALSDQTFIDNGITILPSCKFKGGIRRFEMHPTSEYDWLKQSQNRKLLFYDSGEKLADFSKPGEYYWFYRNGTVALAYYDSPEINDSNRYIVYSNGEPDNFGRSRPYTLLAVFDYLGNGKVLDHVGNVRIKFNQFEGFVLDKKIGPQSHWKWHSLSEPVCPELVPAILGDKNITEKEKLRIRVSCFQKLENKLREKLPAFKPFEIRVKAFKINEYFSLRILNQQKIYLMFRDSKTNFKLNIGMTIDHKSPFTIEEVEYTELSKPRRINIMNKGRGK